MDYAELLALRDSLGIDRPIIRCGESVAIVWSGFEGAAVRVEYDSIEDAAEAMEIIADWS